MDGETPTIVQGSPPRCPSMPNPPLSLGPPLLALPLAVLPLLGACTAETHERRADRSALRILDEGTESTLGDRWETVQYPRTRDPEPEATPPEDPAGEAPDGRSDAPAGPASPPPERRVVTLAEALEIAVRHSRDYKTRREGLYLEALSLASTRHGFAPQLAATLGYVFSDGDDLPAAQDVGFDASVDQILPWGGSAGVVLSSDLDERSGPDEYSSSLSIRLTQPLLRGFGHEVSHEPLVQAERNLVYAIRDFELFREDFSIDVARRYYDLVQQKQGIENQRQNLEGFVFNRRQAEALFEVGRLSELDVLRARRSELGSRNSLLAAEESYELALDRFRIFLGLPATEALDVASDPPSYVPVEFDVEAAIQVALENRLDLLNRREQLEDAARAVRISRDGLRTDLGLTVDYGLATDPDSSFTGQSRGNESVTAGLTLNLPLDRVVERNSYRSARIAQQQAVRNFEEFRDSLVVEIASAFRELERRRQSLDIQAQLITDQEKNVKIAQLRFEQGDFSNRDVVEATEALLDAQNGLIDEQVNHEIARLELLRDLGILFIDERGMWNE